MDDKDNLAKSFGENAHHYRISNVFSNEDDLARMINIINPNKTDLAIDIATGSGHTAIALSTYVKEVIAIDVVENMLNQAAILIQERKTKNISLLKMDVHSLKFEDAYFDIATCRFAPHHFYDINKALKEIYRVLKQSGKLYILDCSVLNLEEAKSIINHIERLRDPSHIKSYSLEEWKSMLENQGFHIEYTRTIKTKYMLPEWFDRMNTSEQNRKHIFDILENMPKHLKELYDFNEKYITTYYVELLAIKQA
ncbi:class I SAM-dependent methyltransferase [Hydrogenobaculum acidophilum]